MAGTSDLANPFVDWLAELLKKQGHRRQWLIENASLDSGHLSRVMNRQVDATPEIILKIAHALGMDEVELLKLAQFIRQDSGTSQRNEVDEILERYRRITEGLTDKEKDIAIDMFEFLAGRLVEERDKKPARAARSEDTERRAERGRRAGHA